MKTYQKVAEVIDLVRAYHHRLQELYTELEESQGGSRLEMLLEYLGRHERRFEDALGHYETAGQREILETWCQFVPDDDLSLEEPRSGQPTLEGVVSTALAVDEKLVRFYARMAEAMPQSSAAQKFFQTLAEQEKQEEASLSVIAEMIREI